MLCGAAACVTLDAIVKQTAMDLAQTAYDDDFDENLRFFECSDLGIEFVVLVIRCCQRAVRSQLEGHDERVKDLEAVVAQYQAIDDDGLILTKR